VSDPVELRQLAPTIADLADVSHPYTAPSLLNERHPWVTSKVFAGGERQAAVRTQSGKYVADADGERLYDLGSVGGEHEDRIEDSPEGRAAFRDALSQHVATEQEKRAVNAVKTEVDGA